MSSAKAICKTLRRTKPPYRCPDRDCLKSYKSFTGMKVHLYKTHCNGLKSDNEILKNIHIPETKAITNHNEAVSCTDSPDIFEVDIDGHVNTLNVLDPISVVSEEGNDKCAVNDNLDSQKMCKYSNCASSKLPEPSFDVIENYCPPAAPPLPSTYYKFPEHIYSELDKEVEYDMDDEDVAWLGLINEQLYAKGLNEVCEDTFELLMDRFEKESFAQAQSIAEDTLATLDENAVCSICNDGECDDYNAILFCDLCNLPVHQECYGVPFIPEGQWLCRPCSHRASSPVECVLCPNKGGAFKPTDDNRWAHVICALWIPEVGFTNPNFLEPIDSLHKIPRARWKLCCYICKQKNVGACIQCKKTSCYTAFHVTCAQEKGLFMQMKAVKCSTGGTAGYEIKKSAYCHQHTPHEPCSLDSGNEDSNDKEECKKQTLTELSVPITSIPDIAPNKLLEIATSFDIPIDRFFFEKLLGYWKLKRQARGGAPLLRRLQITLHSKQKQQPLESEPSNINLQAGLKHLRKLRQDFEKARLLLEMIRKREKLKRQLVQVKMEETMLRLQPFKAVLIKVLESLKKKDLNQIFCEPVDLNVAPDYLDFIKNPMDFSTMKTKILNNQYSSFRQFAADFNLIIDNCLFYNSPETIYHKIALEVKEQCLPILKKAKSEILKKGLDTYTGVFQEDLVIEVPKNTSKAEPPKNNVVRCIKLIRSKRENNRHRKRLKDLQVRRKSCKPSKCLYQEKLKGAPKTSKNLPVTVESDEENGTADSSHPSLFGEVQIISETVKTDDTRSFGSHPAHLMRRCQRNSGSSYKPKYRHLQSYNSLPVTSTNTSVPGKLPMVPAPADADLSNCTQDMQSGDLSPEPKVPTKPGVEPESLDGLSQEKLLSPVDRQLRRKRL